MFSIPRTALLLKSEIKKVRAKRAWGAGQKRTALLLKSQNSKVRA